MNVFWWVLAASAVGLFAGWRLRPAWDSAGSVVDLLAIRKTEPDGTDPERLLATLRRHHKPGQGAWSADFLRKHCPDVSDADLGAAALAFVSLIRLNVYRQPTAADALAVTLCGMGDAACELTAADQIEVPK